MDSMMKRAAISAVAGTVVMAMIAGGTFALFRSQASPATPVTYASGTVTLNDAGSVGIPVENIAPGWGLFWSDHQTWSVSYTGSLDAWVSLDAMLDGELAACDSGVSFDMWMSTDRFAWEVLRGDGASASNLFATYVVNGDGITYYLWPTLWPDASDDCQDKKAELHLTAHAVQAYRNTLFDFTGPIFWDASSVGNSIDTSQIAQDITNARQQFDAARPAVGPTQTKTRQ